MKLFYFDFPGRGEALRDALRLGGLPFEDIRLAPAEFRAAREAGQLPWDSLPVLELDDGTRLGQSNTLLRHVGRMAGLFPEDPVLALQVSAVLDATEDFGGRVSVSIRTADPATRGALRAELAERWLPEWFGLLERRLVESGRGWLVGAALTVADLKVIHHLEKLLDGSLEGLRREALQDFPALSAWRARVQQERARRLAQ